MKLNKKVVVITLNYNQNEYSIKSVESILKSDYTDFHILLIDNGSTTDNYKALKVNSPENDRLTLLRIENNVGYVGGINFGMREALKRNPGYLLVMNNDTIIDKHAIQNLVKTCEKYNSKAIVTGKVYHYDDPERLQYVGHQLINANMLDYRQMGLNEIDVGQYDMVTERAMLDDIFWLLPLNLYKEIGGYSKYFWFNYEQMDFAIRAQKKGYRLVYTPEAKLWHKGSISIGGRDINPKQAYWATQGELILMYLHLTRINFIKFYFIMMVRIIRTFLKAVYLKIMNDDRYIVFAKSKFSGWLYFNKWLLNKQENTGVYPLEK